MQWILHASSSRSHFSPWDRQAQIFGTDAANSTSLLTHFSAWGRRHLDADFSCASCTWLPSLKLNSILVSKEFGLFINESLSKWNHILRQPFYRNYFIWQFSAACLNLEVFIIPGQLYYQACPLALLCLPPPLPWQKLILHCQGK